MNNFGILNLLTRFFDFYLKNKGGFGSGKSGCNDCDNNQFNGGGGAREESHGFCEQKNGDNGGGGVSRQDDPLSNLFKIINDGKETNDNNYCPNEKNDNLDTGNYNNYNNNKNDTCNSNDCERGGGDGLFGKGGAFGNGGIFGNGGLFENGGLFSSLSNGLQGLLSGLGKLLGFGGGNNHANNLPNNFSNNNASCRQTHQQNCFQNCPPSHYQQGGAPQKDNFSQRQSQKDTYAPLPDNRPPLQKSMLATMSAHDQFIKRVKQKHEKTHPF